MASSNGRGTFFATKSELNSAGKITAFPINRMSPGDVVVVTDADTSGDVMSYTAIQNTTAAVPPAPFYPTVLLAGPEVP